MNNHALHVLVMNIIKNVWLVNDEKLLLFYNQDELNLELVLVKAYLPQLKQPSKWFL